MGLLNVHWRISFYGRKKRFGPCGLGMVGRGAACSCIRRRMQRSQSTEVILAQRRSPKSWGFPSPDTLQLGFPSCPSTVPVPVATRDGRADEIVEGEGRSHFRRQTQSVWNEYQGPLPLHWVLGKTIRRYGLNVDIRAMVALGEPLGVPFKEVVQVLRKHISPGSVPPGF